MSQNINDSHGMHTQAPPSSQESQVPRSIPATEDEQPEDLSTSMNESQPQTPKNCTFESDVTELNATLMAITAGSTTPTHSFRSTLHTPQNT